jgi:DNA-binding NarL/FixJ family response regulator/two-component sensor histidine kinase
MPGEPAAASAFDVGQQETLEREILAIADHEKHRLGQELHDGLCQSLAGIAALTSVLSRNLTARAEPGPAAAAAEIVRLLNETIGETRDLARGLSPIGLNGAGLVEALETLARNVSRAHGAYCAFVEDGCCPQLHRETTAHLVRVAQEAVRNAITHGRADEIEIRLACADGSGLLSIRDNGIGLPAQDRSHDGIGLHTMTYRARAIGGSLTVAAQPRRGVAVTCAFPLPPSHAGPEAADHVRRSKSAGPSRKTLLVVDDHPVLRRGLIALIESEPGLIIRGTASTRMAALEAIRENPPDLAIVDLALGDEDGLDLVKEIRARYPAVPSMVLSVHDEAMYAERALGAGALGYVNKQQLGETVLAAIHRVLAGETYMSEALQRRLATRYIGGQTLETTSPLGMLSDRQLQVFRLVGQGRTTRQIAGILNRSVKTIESHLAHIKNKLAIESAAELAQRATRWVETGRIG